MLWGGLDHSSEEAVCPVSPNCPFPVATAGGTTLRLRADAFPQLAWTDCSPQVRVAW